MRAGRTDVRNGMPTASLPANRGQRRIAMATAKIANQGQVEAMLRTASAAPIAKQYSNSRDGASSQRSSAQPARPTPAAAIHCGAPASAMCRSTRGRDRKRYATQSANATPPPARRRWPYKASTRLTPSIHHGKPIAPSCHCPIACAVQTSSREGNAKAPGSVSVKLPSPASHDAGGTNGASAPSSYHTRALAATALTASQGKTGRSRSSAPSVSSRSAIRPSAAIHDPGRAVHRLPCCSCGPGIGAGKVKRGAHAPPSGGAGECRKDRRGEQVDRQMREMERAHPRNRDQQSQHIAVRNGQRPATRGAAALRGQHPGQPGQRGQRNTQQQSRYEHQRTRARTVPRLA